MITGGICREAFAYSMITEGIKRGGGVLDARTWAEHTYMVRIIDPFLNKLRNWENALVGSSSFIEY